jgi:hypothetical protein
MTTRKTFRYLKWILLLITALLLQLVLPWWSIAIAAFGFGFLVKQKYPFLNGFIAIFMLWAGLSTYISLINEWVLAARLAMLAGSSCSFAPILITGLMGGITGGLAALSGAYLKKLTN